MKLSPELESKFQEQYNVERQNSAFYEAVEGMFANIAYDGFAHFCHNASDGEREHSHKFFEFLVDRNAQPGVSSLEMVNITNHDSLGLFRALLAREQSNTSRLNTLYAACCGMNDNEACVFLQPFLTEQREDERELQDIINQLTRAAGNEAAILIIDHQLKGTD